MRRERSDAELAVRDHRPVVDVPAEDPVGADRAARRVSLRFSILGAGCLLLLAALHVALNLGLPVPQLLADEEGYLGNARFVASGFGQSGAGYAAGYSFLLVPAALITDAPREFYRAALLTNAIIAIAAPLLAYRLARRLFPHAPRWHAALSAAVVGLSPFVFSFAGLAMSENALVPVTLGVALLVARTATTDALWPRMGAASLGAFAFWVSPRGLIVAVASVLACMLAARDRRAMARTFAVTVAVVLAAALLGILVGNVVKGTSETAGLSGESRGLVWALFHVSGWRMLFGGIFGRVAYIGAASLGLTLVGTGVAGSWALARAASDEPLRRSRRGVGLFAALVVVATLVANAVAVAGTDYRGANYIYYGRYVEAVAMPALVVGVGWILSAERVRVIRAALLSGACIVLGVLGVAVVARTTDDATVNYANVFGLYPIRVLLEQPSPERQALLAALLGTALLLLFAFRTAVAGAILVALLFGGAIVVHDRYLVPGSKGRARQNAIAQAVATLEARGISADCIALDRDAPGYPSWNEYNSRFLLPATRFVAQVDPVPQGCGPLVVSSGLEYGSTRPLARLVAIENDTPMSLWIDLDRLPSADRDRIERAGLHFPEAACGELPDETYEAVIDAAVASRNADPRSVVLDLEIEHAGAGSPWLGSLALIDCGRVNVIATLTDDSDEIVYERRIAMPRGLLPGESARVRTDLVAEGAAAPPYEAGRNYAVRIALVHEGVRIFGGPAGEGVVVPVD
jgi:hypothetical protein